MTDKHLDDLSIQQNESDSSHEHLPAGYVALIGSPNTGKSTLMNHILGVELAITTSKPQTTRNQILGVRTYPGVGQLCFVDTPGLHHPTRDLNRRMNASVAHAFDHIDVACHVIDATQWIKKDTVDVKHFQKENQLVYQILKDVDIPVNLVINKVDRIKNKTLLLPLLEALTPYYSYKEIVPLSALSGDNVDALVHVLLSQLPKEGFLFDDDMLTDKAEKFIAAEFIREAIMEQTYHELPYSVAVEIERFQETDRCLKISAVIHLERDAQKAIIIGKGGSRIKEIGQQARLKMAQFFNHKVFLETFVRVEDQWSDNPVALDRFGYGEGQ